MLSTTSPNRNQEVLSVADDLFRQEPDWVTFFREVLGIDGIVRKAFPDNSQLAEFELSHEFDLIQRMLTKLRENRSASDTETEPTRVITVRLPKSMHEYLKTEAYDCKTSMNKLCISKLLQVIDAKMIPVEKDVPARKSLGTEPADNSETPVGFGQTPPTSNGQFGM